MVCFLVGALLSYFFCQRSAPPKVIRTKDGSYEYFHKREDSIIRAHQVKVDQLQLEITDQENKYKELTKQRHHENNRIDRANDHQLDSLWRVRGF